MSNFHKDLRPSKNVHCPTCGRFMRKETHARIIEADGRAYPAAQWLCTRCQVRSITLETIHAGRVVVHFDLPPNKPGVRWETF